jgi:hypothetical protein
MLRGAKTMSLLSSSKQCEGDAPDPTPDASAPTLEHSRAWLLAGLAAVLLRGLPDLRYPMGVDQAIYAMVGQGLLHGQFPYRDLWDIKPPGIYYIYALVVRIIGPVMWSVGVVDLAWLLAISLCIFYFARRYLGAPAAALAMLFNASRHCRIGYNNAAQAESFLMLCVFAAWFLLNEGEPSAALASGGGAHPRQGRGRSFPLWAFRCFAAGLALGASLWLKYNAVVFFPVVLLLPFLDLHGLDQGLSRIRMTIPWKSWLARMSFVAVGFVLAIVAVWVHFWAAGAWPAMKEAHFGLLPRYGATAFQWDMTYLVQALRSTQFILGLWTEVMVALSLALAWWRREVASLAPALLLALAGYLCVATQGRFHIYHFQTCHALLSIFWGYACVRTWEGLSYVRKRFMERRWAVASALTWVVLASLVFATLSEESVRVVQQYTYLADWWKDPSVSYQNYYPQLALEKLSEQLRVIDFVKHNSDPEDTVYVWGMAPLVNFLTARRSPSRFFYNYPLISTWGLQAWRRELVQTLESKRPRYIVVERNDGNPLFTNNIMTSEQYLRLLQYPGLSNLLRDRYKPAVNYSDFEIYELQKSPAGESEKSAVAGWPGMREGKKTGL